MLADLDFETYSEAGFEWDEAGQKWKAPQGATKKGLFAVGAAAYAEHPSTEILSLAYDLKDGLGARLWVPHAPLPLDLFAYLKNGGLIEAWNDSFEHWIWLRVAHERMGWPAVNFWQFRDAMAKARAYALPGALAKAGQALNLEQQKDADGKRLIQKFSVPRKPTKANVAKRIHPDDDPIDAANLYRYNLNDIRAEAAVSALCPELTGIDLEFWLCTRALNVRGIAVDMKTVNAGVKILDQALVKYNAELHTLTKGTVTKASEVQRLQGWLGGRGVRLKSLDVENLNLALKRNDLPAPARRALELRQLVGSAGVKKLYAIKRRVCKNGRVHDLFIFNGARTGRDTGADVQPQNLVKAGPKLYECQNCGAYSGQHLAQCRCCSYLFTPLDERAWNWRAVEQVAEVIRSESLEHVEAAYGDALLALSGVIRGLFIAAPGTDLIASDYSSIEAVVAAVLSGEQWRIKAFHEKQDIYLVSAAQITLKDVAFYENYKAETGEKHPDRQKIGKPAELGLGFGGWLNGWRQFDSSDTFTDDQVKQNIIAWRGASPAIVEMWGGQSRGKPWRPDRYELFGLEGMAIAAVQSPGQPFAFRGITYQVQGDALFCQLPSGRKLTYHRPRLAPSTRWDGQLELTFEGWNTNPKNGAMGWVRINTFGGRLFENCLAEGTQVLTDSGWKAIENIAITDKVHDGKKFVPHGGLLFKSVQECVSIEGVYMTLDHEVLTNDGWKEARTQPRPYRPDLRGLDGVKSESLKRQKVEMVLSMRVRESLRKSFLGRNQRRKERPHPKLWVPNKNYSTPKTDKSRAILPPCLRGLSVDVGSVSTALTSRVEKLWGSRNFGLCAVANGLRELLARYGLNVRKGFGVRPPEQRRGLLPAKLSVGFSSSQLEQPKKYLLNKHALGSNVGSSSLSKIWDWKNDSSLPIKTPVARSRLIQKPVYDILNAGLRQRFVVKGDNEPFIVHNCVQAVANDILRFANVTLERAGYPIILRVHDELIAEVPEGTGSIEEFERLMATMPAWAEGWPIRAAGGWRAKRYRKD